VDAPSVPSLTIHCHTTCEEACQSGEVAIEKMLVSRPTNSTDQRTSSISHQEGSMPTPPTSGAKRLIEKIVAGEDAPDEEAASLPILAVESEVLP
jgi:hypothetical protein